ncbi:MAG: hypothetical protein QY308_03290 [Ignavibacteriaceae bacterium]|nr:MAG: hypothetical protein QY308_03290 [Ignavibacteriaceae bacterium]
MLELFDGIYGQEPVKEILYRFLIHKSKPQALLFTGASGVGKEFMAIRFANLINSMKTPILFPQLLKIQFRVIGLCLFAHFLWGKMKLQLMTPTKTE